MQEKKFIVNPIKAIVSILTILTCLILSASCLQFSYYLMAALLFGIAALFVWQLRIYGASVVVSFSGVEHQLCKKATLCHRWTELAEVGVVGTKVFNNNNPKKTGERYIYFSTKPLSEEERFQLALTFPPKDMIFLRHNQEREDFIRILWNKPFEGYNAGDHLNKRED